VSNRREPFPVLAELARRFGVEQYRLAMLIVLLALPLLSMLIAEVVAPFV
jgi:hypothetical protein